MKYTNYLLPAILLLFGVPALAQPFTLDPNINPTELTLVNFEPPNKPLAKGMTNVTDVTQVADTQYFFIKGISIYSPVYFSITAKDKMEGLRVDLCKANWLAASRSGVTDANGHWEDKFKTEGDFGIRVIAKNKPATYALVTWVGKEADIDIPSAFVYSETGTGGGNKNMLLYGGIAAAVLLLVVVFIIKRKKK